MKNKNYWILTAGLLALFTALVHLFMGQVDLVNPLQESELSLQVKTELLGVWHMGTALLTLSSIVLFKNGLKYSLQNSSLLKFIATLYLLCGVAFIFACVYNSTFAPQWTILVLIGVLTLIGVKKAV